MLEVQVNVKNVVDKTEKFRCPISLLIFLDPVVASDGHTYEREEIERVINGANPVSPKTRELLTKVLTPNHDKRGAVLEYLEDHKELYEQDEVYLSTKFKQQLVNTITEGDVKAVVEALKKDPRLSTTSLTDSGQTCLALACSQPSIEVLRSVLNNLPAKIVLNLKQASKDTLGFLSAIALSMETAGLMVWCDVLVLNQTSFFPALAFYAISLNSIDLLRAAAEKIDINIIETENKRSLLHRAALVCAESMKALSSSEIPQENMVIMKYLFSKNIDGKLKDGSGLTAAAFAKKLGYPALAFEMEVERRRAKLLPVLGPMIQESQARLITEVGRLSTENAQLISTLENTQQELALLSSAFASAEIQKIERAFKPHTCKSYSHSYAGEISGMVMVGENHMVTLVRDNTASHGKSKLCIWDLTHPPSSSCIKTIAIDPANGFELENDFFALDETRFIFLEKRGISEGQKKSSVKFVVWNVVKNEEERSFILDYSRVRILQAVNSTTIFFYCIKNQANSFCAALLDIITGKVTPHEYLDIKDYDRVSFISCGTPQLAYIRNCGDYDSTGLYLYNCLTKQSSRLTPEELQYRSWSGVFKFVTKDLIALRCGDYKEVKPVRLFDIRTQQFVQAFSHPTVGTGFYAKSPMILGACEAGQNKFATVAVVDKNFQLILWDMQNGTIKYQVEIPAKSTEHPIAMTYDTQRDLLYVACGDVVNAMQLTPNLTDTYAASLANNKSLKL